ncbi:type VI secretion system protein TssA [Andreprevotia chitinilytica]|uniref:type VI secretion system protein TssA n=1 Tax=Andreprevotia chitinilytica TaxID=396808 RepID=UPI000550490E|nr:type VI secretion system protein TssA [Andreprevotia chitinilytica]
MSQDLPSPLIAIAERYFLDQLGVSLESILAPVSAQQPEGESLRGSAIYRAIQQAREFDDPSLPQGQWERDLKQADWEKGSALALEALVHRSKDLQLAAWLLEARLNITGMDSIAPCMVLMDLLCRRYWPTLHPQLKNGEATHRANLVSWINEKLLSTIRQTPITASGNREFCWADWEQARRNEAIRAEGGRNAQPTEGATLAEFNAAASATHRDSYLWLYDTLKHALEAIAQFSATLREYLGPDAPGLHKLADLLERILSLAEAELYRRGIRPEAVLADMAEEAQDDTLSEEQMTSPRQLSGQIIEREEAYARLAEAADFLMRLEPHSPVPYLVRRAIEWGNLNTVELYQQLFLKFNGQISIFELLGLEGQQAK